MPWPREHKRSTRQRIVQAAAAAFRAGGVSDVRVDQVMKRAGLTHGGFYAHFSSKDNLLREALDEASRQTLERLSQALGDVSATDRLQAVADAYLSPKHAAHPEMGCPLAALGPEIVRAGGATERRFAQNVKERIKWMRQLDSQDGRGTHNDEQVIGALACMVGGVILARAAGQKDSDAILRACRVFVRDRTKNRPTAPNRRRRHAASI